MDIKPKYKLFEVTGVELEYMIVDRDSLRIKPIADVLMYDKSGRYAADIENGEIEWSNELVNHIIELKTHLPVTRLDQTAEHFHKNITEINKLLEKHNAMLMPTAAHPFMDPYTETTLWKHDFSEIYDLYNKIFDCKGHGWSNLQSMHLNLPFSDDEEFARLHAAIRLVLPIIPALTASSPLLDGELTGWADSRMEAYLHHQEIMPSFMGRLIPEPIYSEDDYNLKIFYPIKQDIAPFDQHKIMEHHFLNSRGAIARFDRGAIEIRVIDTQECPSADIAVAALINEVIKTIVNEKWAKFRYQSIWKEDDLYVIFKKVIKDGDYTLIGDGTYLRMFGLKENEITALELWKYLLKNTCDKIDKKYQTILNFIIENGNLSSRIIKSLNNALTLEKIKVTYKELSNCLKENRLFRA